jgi:hypothetical protein
MAAPQMIETIDGRRIRATYVRHLRTLTGSNSLGSSNQDIDVFRTTDGREVICQTPDDARATPVEVDGSETEWMFV